MLTIEPRPASRIAEPKTWIALKVPDEIHVHRSAEVLERDVLDPVRRAADSGGWSIPALLTRIDGVPNRSRTAASAARSVTSAGSTPGASRHVEPDDGLRPRASSASVHTGPSFPSAPVTIATRPSEAQVEGHRRSS